MTVGEERLLRRILDALPPSDRAEYGEAFFREELRQALIARETFPWCGELEEELFFRFVAYPRINDELLEPCREVFRRALTPRIQGKTLPQAILEVNQWCAEQATYRSTDQRTSSAMEVYRRGWGRCGEETVLAVNALRSVGIAARQVYCPWWSHCDDNHAWVEVYDGENWRYMGACEPEPVLDRGWFQLAASRAMMIHSREFTSPPEDPEDPDAYFRHGLLYRVRTARYAPTRVLTALVTDAQGRPVPRAKVVYSVANLGAWLPIGEKRTSDQGLARLRLGLGGVHIRCDSQEGDLGEAVFDTATVSIGEIRLTGPKLGERALLFLAPVGNVQPPEPLSDAQRAARRAAWAQAAAERARKIRPRAVPGSAAEERVLATLPEKDRAVPVDALVLAEAAEALSWEGRFPEPVFSQGLLCPRIGREPLRPWRRALRDALTPEQRRRFQADPREIGAWLGAFRVVDSYPTLTASPLATLAGKKGNPASLAVLFCAVCRCLGIPARLSPLDESPEYYWDGAYRSICGPRTAKLTLEAQDQPVTLSKWDGETPLVTVEPGKTWTGLLPPGPYRAMAAARLPNGDQLLRERILSLEAGETRLALAAPQPAREQLTISRPLPVFRLRDGSGTWRDSRRLLTGWQLLCFLEPGREPTEHLLLELTGNPLPCPVLLIVPEGTTPVSPFQGAERWTADPETPETLARNVFAPPDLLPLSLLCRDGVCRFAAAGYNVGIGKILTSVLRENT